MAKSARSRPPIVEGPSVVLVHGAWTDGSSWNEVIARLQVRGLHVVSVQNRLRSLAGDAAGLQRALEQQKGPVVLVGHGWGGTVITEAGNSPKVCALVYVAAFAPDRAESTQDLQGLVAFPGYATLLQSDSNGYLWFPQDALPDWFAQDLPAANANALAATQNPIHASAFEDRVSNPAWRSKPTWYLVTEKDRIIAPELQRAMAARMKANTTSIEASHAAFASRPEETAELILDVVESACARM